MHPAHNEDFEGLSSSTLTKPGTSPAQAVITDASDSPSRQERANTIAEANALSLASSNVSTDEKSFQIPGLGHGDTPSMVHAKTVAKSADSELVLNDSLCDDTTVEYMKMVQKITEPGLGPFRSPRVSGTP